MRNFINQVGNVIYRFFSLLYGFFTQQQPVTEHFFSKISSIDLTLEKPLVLPILSTITINELLEQHRLNSYEPPRIMQVESFSDETLRRNSDHLTGVIPNVTQWNLTARWSTGQRPESDDDELAMWWRNLRRQRRCEQFSAAVTLLDDDIYAKKLERYPNLKVDPDFICSISREIMTNPVYDPAFPQQKYDLLVIESWLCEHETNPCTRTQLLTENLVYDDALKLRIDRFMNDTLAHTDPDVGCNVSISPGKT